MFLITLFAVCACNSPLDIDTPRDRFVDDTNNVSVDTANSRVSVAIALDASGSMSGAGRIIAMSGAQSLIDSLDGTTDEAAILWFADAITLQQPMTTKKDSLRNAVSALPAVGITLLWDGTWSAIREVVDHGMNPSRGVIVITDGMDNASSRTADQVLAFAVQNKIPVSFIGLGVQIPETELRLIADSTHGRFFQIHNALQADSAFLSILENLR